MLEKEKEDIENTLEEYKKEYDVHLKIKEEKTRIGVDLEEERKILEKELSEREADLLNSKNDLEKLEAEHTEIQNENYYLIKELEALKEHAQVLEKQNSQLHKELDQIVETDELIRKDLDRRSRLEFIKTKNYDELQKSVEMIKKSGTNEFK